MVTHWRYHIKADHVSKIISSCRPPSASLPAPKWKPVGPHVDASGTAYASRWARMWNPVSPHMEAGGPAYGSPHQ